MSNYNRLIGEYRVKRCAWNQDGSIKFDVITLQKSVLDNQPRNPPALGFGNNWFVNYPYTHYWQWCIKWWFQKRWNKLFKNKKVGDRTWDVIKILLTVFTTLILSYLFRKYIG